MLKLLKEKSSEFHEVYSANIRHDPSAGVFENAYKEIFHNISNYLATNKNEKTDYNWHFIPLTTSVITRGLMAVKEYISLRDGNSDRHWRFLDCGCGPGNVIMQAKWMSIFPSNRVSYHGIEFDKRGVKLAKILLKIGDNKPITKYKTLDKPVHVWNSNVLTFKYYKNYDVLYYYSPIKICFLEQLFEEIMEDEMKVGAVIMHNMKASGIINRDKRFKLISVINNGDIVDLFEKISDKPRTNTIITRRHINKIPEKYHKLFKNHLKKVSLHKG